MRLADRVALVTGAGSGIGRAIAERFAREGARIVVVDRFGDAAQATVEHIQSAGGIAQAFTADVACATDVAAMAEQALHVFERVDVLVNNAGFSDGDDIRTIDETTWDAQLAVVLKSVFLCTKTLVPHMIARGHGAIVNISSVNGLGGYGEEAYSAAKAGMINLTQNLAVKYGRYGIRANCLCPATIRTPIWQPQLDQQPNLFEKLAQWYPLGRVGTPDDVANAALFLASDEAAWITGVVVPVDGGLSAGNFRMTYALLEGKPYADY